MKRCKKMLAVCALFALLFMVCVPVFSAANAEEEKTVLVTISGTSECYGDNGKQVGVLKPGNDAQPTFRANESKEEIPVIILYSYAAEDAGLGTDKLEGKVKVTLQIATPEENALNGTPDPNASPTPEIAATPQPELPSAVWVDASIVIPALNSALIQKDIDILDKDDLIAALQENAKVDEPEGSPAPTSEGADENPNTEEVRPELLQSLLLPIIGCAVSLVIAGGVIWMAISSARIAREAKENNSKTSTKNAHLDSMKGSLETISKRTDTGRAIEEALIDQANRKPYMRMVASETGETRTILARIESKMDVIPQAQSQSNPHPGDVRRREVIELTNSLAGVASREDWANIIQQKGYRYVLVQTSPTDRDALQEDRTGNSVLACLMKGAEAEEAYLVPSFEDPSAGENRWKDFYTVTDDPAVKYYRIDEPTVMKVINKTFFVVDTSGKLFRRP